MLVCLVVFWDQGSCPALTLLVYNNNDSGPGSFRQALADNRGLGGGSTVIFSNIVSGTIRLLGGELVISNDVTIVGPGAGSLVIDGNRASRIFNLSGNADVNISGLAVTGGRPPGLSAGGGILQSSGTLALTDCLVRGNSIDHGDGGGLYVGGTALLSRCTFTENNCYVGGGIENVGTLAAVNCTVSGNSGFIAAGGIMSYGVLQLTNCTISGNTSSGGLVEVSGVYSQNTTLRNTIIAGNTGTGNPDVYGTFESQGYNLIGAANGATGFTAIGDQVGTTNAILNARLLPLGLYGGSTLTMPPGPGSPAIDQGNSLGVADDQRGRPRPIDHPGIINATLGDGCDIGAVEVGLVVTTTDDSVAGSLRQVILAASANENSIVFATNVVGTITLTDGVLGVSKDLNIIGPGARQLTISGNNNGDLFEILSGNASISGLTLANGRKVGTAGVLESNGAEARGGGLFNQATLALSGCVLSNNVVIGGQGGPAGLGSAGGGGNGLGGAIANIGTLTMVDCHLISNSASGGGGGVAMSGGFDGNGGQAYGGGIYSAGPLTLVRCTLSQNSANGGAGGGGVGSGSGGGLYNDASATLTTCTVAGNSAGGSAFDFGGGIFQNGTQLTLLGSTVAGNQADYGGGLYLSAPTDIGDTILAQNSAGSSPDCSGTINSRDYNLIGNTSGATVVGAMGHNITEQNPQLGPLADNGGPTPTMVLLAGSPALDRGHSLGQTTDQRGAPRIFDFAGVVDAGGGDGSDMGAFEQASPRLRVRQGGGDIVVSWPSYYGNFSVQSVAKVSAPDGWISLPGTPAISGNEYRFIAPISGGEFFRLKSRPGSAKE